MLKEILAVSGKPGLYKLVSKKNNLLIIESLVDKKRIPAYARDKVISLGEISIYTDKEEVSIGEVLTAIKEKENGGNVSLDLAKAQPDDLRAYFAEILPNFDRKRVYPSDIKKILKWYEILITNQITDFSKEEEEKAVQDHEEESTVADDPKESPKTPPAKATKTTKATKRREDTNAMTATKAKVAKPKTSTPKKSVVGAKRGS
jgi:hypothetical protein